MKTWPMEPCDPETSLRFHGDVAGFGSLRRADLHTVRRQLWRWENYITHISAVIAYGNGNPLGSMGLNEEADMWELAATAWTGLSLGWRRFCGVQNSVSMQPRMGKYMEIRFLFLSGFSAARVSEWQRLQHGICMLGTFAQCLLSILISMQLLEPVCSLGHEAVT